MLTEILMESLLAMDDDTLDRILESCDDSEIDLINDMVTETSQPMSAQDKKDFDFISFIQAKARRDGWGEVTKKDRDKFVNIMSHSENLPVLKKAIKIGEKEAAHDDKVNQSLNNIVAASAILGGLKGGRLTKSNIDKSNMLTNMKYNGMSRVEARNAQAALDEVEKLKQALPKDKYDQLIQTVNANANNAMDKIEQARNSELISGKQIFADTMIGAGSGAAAAGLTSAGIVAIRKAIHNAKLHNRDKEQLAKQGESQTPTERWKAARKNLGK